jgi:hypothetical protein
MLDSAEARRELGQGGEQRWGKTFPWLGKLPVNSPSGRALLFILALQAPRDARQAPSPKSEAELTVGLDITRAAHQHARDLLAFLAVGVGMLVTEKLVRLASCVLVSVWFFPTTLNAHEPE